MSFLVLGPICMFTCIGRKGWRGVCKECGGLVVVVVMMMMI
jgi:hypothetical protein